MVKFSIIEVIAEATQDNDLAFRVFEIIRPMKAWELEEQEKIGDDGLWKKLS